MTPYAQASDQYLAQRIMSASPEQLMAILLEGAQRFTGLAIQAIRQKDGPGKSRHLGRVTEFIDEMIVRLNHEEGGETVSNLSRIYQGWIRILMEVSESEDISRLERVAAQMGEFRPVWEQLHQQKMRSLPAASFQAGNLVG